MGPINDVQMMQYQNMMHPQGSIQGQAVPSVSGMRYGGYTAPANWSDPAVASQNLMVHTDELRKSASSLSYWADRLQGVLTTWQQEVEQATVPSHVGEWSEAAQLSRAIKQTHAGVSQFVGDLVKAHTEVAKKLSSSAENYDSAEQTNVKAINAASEPSAWKIGSGGQNEHVDPFYGDHLSPQQQAMAQHLTNMNPGDSQVWNGTVNITANAPFQQTSTAGLTTRDLQQRLQNTKPEAITAAGDAFKPLVETLTTITGKLAIHGQALASNWGGSTAVTAVSQVQQMHQTATDLQANAWQAQQALSWYGPVLAVYKQNLPQPTKASNAGVLPQAVVNAQNQANEQAANQAAQQRMTALNQHIATAYNAMPPNVNKNLPPAPKSSGSNLASAGGGAGSGGGVPPVSPVSGTGGAPPVSGTGGGQPVNGVPPVSVPGPGGQPPTTLSSGGGPSPAPVTTPITSPGSPVPGGSGPGSTVPIVNPGVPGGGSGSTGAPGDGGDPVPGEGEIPGLPKGLTDPGGVPGDASGVPGDGSTAAGDGVGVPGAGSGAGGDGLASDGSGAVGDGAGEPGFPGMGGMGGMGGGGTGGQGRMRDSWESEDQGMWDPQDEAVFGAGPGVSADGMIGSDAVSADFGAPAAAGFGPADGFGPAGGAGDAGFAPLANGVGDGATAGGGGFPMMGGAGGGQRNQNDRMRQAWMQEDPDIWGEEADRRVPPVIG